VGSDRDRFLQPLERAPDIEDEIGGHARGKVAVAV